MLPRGHASFIAGLDADMIPERRWLRAQLPHLVSDARMAFTCPPPCFYNVPTDDPISQSLFAFHKFEEIVKDSAGIAWCTGSGWVMRRTALAEIGGFPAKSLTEDLLCGKLLLGRGWRSAYIQETLQWGLVPDTYHAHIRQRTRWSTGGVQAGLIMKLCLFGDLSRHLNGWQRAYSFWYLFQNASATLKTLEVLKTMLMLIFGWPTTVFADKRQLASLVRVAALGHIANFVRQCLIAYVNGYAASSREIFCLYFMNTCTSIRRGSDWASEAKQTVDFALDHWRTFVLPTRVGGRLTAFCAIFPSTGSLPDELNERKKALRAPFCKRLQSVLIKDGGVIHLLVSLGFMFGFFLNIKRAYMLYPSDLEACFLYLLPRVFWVSAMWPAYTVAFLRPFWYATFPPTMQDREHLLERDATKVAYPKDESKLPKSPIRGLGLELVNTVSAVWAFGLLIGTW
ncbi:hypothetical protein HIM_08206 [Hirsutella minnesotensis 3608]|uniref:Glycosyltransferase 2-like domain-containing protein n=1 Tax=Hirsutella minnesotensis 3608 TaxID=1043627 RepID=A0A0F7ZT31_9HYPO|nr:hypothetical protein HIM_08206 [Hirsutella minnesotensis 3608]